MLLTGVLKTQSRVKKRWRGVAGPPVADLFHMDVFDGDDRLEE